MTVTDGELVTIPRDEYANLNHLVELFQEALVDQQLARDDIGWRPLGGWDGEVVNRRAIREMARKAKVMAIADPLIRRAVNLRVAYVWGQGVTIGAAEPGGSGDQDVNAVVQAFLADQAATFSSAQACEERERALMTTGNQFLALPTDPVNGRVQVRRIPDYQIQDIITDPEDADTPWFYKREYTATDVIRGAGGLTSTHTATRTVYYPALGHNPNRKPSTINGHKVAWDTPVLHVRVNRPDGSLWGTTDLWAALPWAEGYKDFLVDWAKLVKALARIAFRATAKTSAGAALMRSKIAAATEPGAVVTLSEGQSLEAVGKSGATIDAESGRPLAAMVASATDVPVTMLMSDPGVTGARATAETLDRPLYLITTMRRELAGTVITRVLDYVVDMAIKAPQGPLRGSARVDPATGQIRYVLAGDQDRGIFVDWPKLDQVDIKTQMEAIQLADAMGKLPPLLIARLALQALDVDNPDSVLAELTDDDGNFVDPNIGTDAAVAQAAIRAFNDGADPAAALRPRR